MPQVLACDWLPQAYTKHRRSALPRQALQIGSSDARTTPTAYIYFPFSFLNLFSFPQLS